MKRIIYLPIFIIIFLAACTTKEKIMPPEAKKISKELTTHGDTRIDNYYWMNDQEDPEVIAHLEAENTYKDEVMMHTQPLQDKLFDEIKSKIKQEDESVPYKKNGYFYYSRTVPEKEYNLVCRKKETMAADEEIMLNVNEMADGHEYFAVGRSSVSPDNKLLAYGVDKVSRRKYTIHFKNLETGEILKDAIPLTTGGATWANDNKTVYYVLKDDVTLRSMKIMKHTLGTPVNDDVEVFYEDDETFSTFIYKTKSEDYLIIGSQSTLTSEFRFLDANNPDGEFKIVQPRTRELEYSVDHFGNDFYIRTNLDALNFKLVKTPVTATEKENWQEVIAHRRDVYFSDFDILKDYLVVSERKEGITQLRVMPWEGQEYFIDFEEEVYTVRSNVNLDFDTDVFRFSYTSMTTPNSIFDFNLKTKERELLKQTEVLGGFDKSNYETKRIYATAMDGTKIPMSVVYRKGMEKNGNNPAVIYGYGSYGYTRDPSFSLSILPLLDRGFVYAIAHIRGGQVNGRAWYEDGKLLKKMNTFTDFNDCAQFLIDEKYTSSEKLFAKGGSAGGLLMGTCVNLKPDLYQGIIAAVPFVDVVTTMLDETIPLTTSEFDEWGNPKIEKFYYYMKSYSPIDNVVAKDYPAMLVTTGLHDSQVQYWEPAKWVAKLRELKTDDNLLLFHINMDFGHGGASGRFQWIKDTALEYAFIFDQLGIE
ncbi:MAG: S9 family peptidase [Prolixibacteraceae bacterium]|jgi:oligopeptidase B|nr:S9 family peptidase [Prolixibacteraceae bacterium]MBT6766379.1 S9 family peptidase [Prolixibacteraceae bacterium]MBT6998335.1 S9 family peptidase [Prolixibacteraceae bacterium]MBT7397070.1 S9 family peptidase [Prolixibacteraceae bacterium]